MALPEEPLSSGEEFTLRRIANGGGYLSALRPQDVERLLTLKLIYRDSRKVQVTPLGRQRLYSLDRR